MGQITKTTNPTGLTQVDKKHFIVRIDYDASGGRVFWLDNFDFVTAKLDSSLHMSCIAYAGNMEEYFELGALSDLKKSPMSIRAIASDKPLKFRFVFNRPGAPLLVGYADGVRAFDEAGYLGVSLVDIEPTKLNGIVWKLTLPEGSGTGEKPNILVERTLFPSATSALNHPWFGVLVMPEVMRQIALAIAQSPFSLEDPETWISSWKGFIDSLGVSDPIHLEGGDTAVLERWADEVVQRFAEKGILRHNMNKVSLAMEGEDL